jgi:hypothetical protein
MSELKNNIAAMQIAEYIHQLRTYTNNRKGMTQTSG